MSSILQANSSRPLAGMRSSRRIYEEFNDRYRRSRGLTCSAGASAPPAEPSPARAPPKRHTRALLRRLRERLASVPHDLARRPTAVQGGDPPGGASTGHSRVERTALRDLLGLGSASL